MHADAQEAQQDLETISETTNRTRRMIASAGGDRCFMLWGLIWMIGFLNCQFMPSFFDNHVVAVLGIQVVWLVLIVAGIAGTILISRRFAPTRQPGGWRIGVFWWVLYAYAGLWVSLLFPFIVVNGYEQAMQFSRHMGAISATIPMFAYVVMGLFLDHYMVWIGLVITALTLFGLFFLPGLFWIWMAFAGGGMLFGTGIIVRRRWRK